MIELATALQAESATVRWQALAQFNRAAATELAYGAIWSKLAGMLADEHAFVRWQAGLALVSQPNGRQQLTEWLKSYPSPQPNLFPNLAQAQTDLAYSAIIDALTTQESAQLKAYLTALLSAERATLRQSAAEALARQTPSTEVIPHLLAALKDDDCWVRRAALTALARLGDTTVSGVITPYLNDKAVIVRRSAAYALGALRAKTALPALKISLTDSDSQVRRNAAWALGRIGQAEAVPNLTRLLDDETLNGAVAAAAEEAIKTIKKPLWQRLLPGLKPKNG